MIYKSYADLARLITSAAGRIKPDVDLIVGIPRSGMLAASITALHLNCPLTDVQSFCINSPLAIGRTRGTRRALHNCWDAKNVLVLDDSAASGISIEKVRQQIQQTNFTGNLHYGVVYSAKNLPIHLDIIMEVTSFPRIFQWNLFHRNEAKYYCVDIDGVLCVDPTNKQNDDGDSYRDFLLNATQLAKVSYPLGHLVTSRLERYRPETESWLAERGIEFKQLHMLDLPSAQERRRLGIHASFKASIYKQLTDTMLFVESESHQANEIARLVGKPVLNYGTQALVDLTLVSSIPSLVRRRAGRLIRGVRRRLG